MTNTANHHSKWRVIKDPGYTVAYRWGVHPPTDMCSDYQPRDGFATFAEAQKHAARESLKAWLIEQFSEMLEPEGSLEELAASLRHIRDYYDARSFFS